ncbi:hypothetical protein DVH24_019223 [Malus domestica]|uniref:Retrotransposon Copia-like N-terminal domain-containing protein n=1 Tax=Malus domestica TaxID=3750 RepID=A0A498I2T0_MALDO|nr:hypothetical protein DVH24_019223 [Malus domestica]
MATSSSSLLGQSTANFIKLSTTNYIVWVCQLKAFLIGHDRWKYLDSSSPSPPPTIANPQYIEVNPLSPSKFLILSTSDQLVNSYLMSTISESLLYLTIGCATSHTLWDCLHTHFSQTSVPNGATMCLSKGSNTAEVYIQEAKSLADHLLKSVKVEYQSA